MPTYIMVCEGYSERAYLQRLQSFLESQTRSFEVPLRFIPKLPETSDGDENGGGFYWNVSSCYKQQRKENKKSKIEVWVDDDIYIRQDSAAERKNRTSYLGKPAGIPDFLFSFHNFEDFLVLHLDEDAKQRWHAAFDSLHIAQPLHSTDYLSRYEAVIPGYQKGALSPDFITRESLSRLKANLERPLVQAPADNRFRSFAHFLITQIDAAFPGLLGP
jgi:hypothetical protein